ncbi:MAG: spore coat protein [Oscillospiraceae bacterium]|nr:spore coat protein [Oscillospiraceae bacterium]
MVDPNKCTQFLGDREIMQDGLISQKHIAEGYNTYAGECVSEPLRTAFLNILNEEHAIQADIFCDMQSRGWYPVESAPQQKVAAARQKFAQQP